MNPANRRPGHRQGIPRYRRDGQLALVLPGTLQPQAPGYCERNVLSGSLGCFCAERGITCQDPGFSRKVTP